MCTVKLPLKYGNYLLWHRLVSCICHEGALANVDLVRWMITRCAGKLTPPAEKQAEADRKRGIDCPSLRWREKPSSGQMDNRIQARRVHLPNFIQKSDFYFIARF